jgi:peptide subunit release factor 1 (eRF1)
MGSLKTSEWAGEAGEAGANAKHDLDWIRAFVTGFERGNQRGLAIFCCSGLHLKQVYTLPCLIEDNVSVGQYAVIRPLATLLNDNPAYVVALVDRTKARLFRVQNREIVESEPVIDDVYARFNAGEMERHIERHIGEDLHRHLQNVSARLRDMIGCEKPDLLVVRGTPGLLPEFVQLLPHEVMNRLVTSTEHLLIDMPESEVMVQAADAIGHNACRQQAQLMHVVMVTASAGGAATTGLEPTLHALNRNSVRTLILQRDPQSINGYLEEAIRLAYRQGADVRFVYESPEWTKCGSIGALLKCCV